MLVEKNLKMISTSIESFLLINSLLENSLMNNLVRATVLRYSSHRGITMSIAQNSHLEESIILEAETKLNHKNDTVNDYLTGLQINQVRPHTPVKSIIYLSQDFIENGSHVRSLLVRNDIRKLQTLLLDVSDSSSLGTLVAGLSRQEINVLLSKLTNSQIEALNAVNSYKRALSYKQYQQSIEYFDTLFKRISQFYLQLRKTQTLTIDETDKLLQMLLENGDYYRAALWIRTIRESGLDQSVFFQNAKLQVLGQTSLYKLDYNSKIINKKNAKYKAKSPRVDWGTLLTEFSLVAGSIIPNLETHKELIHGFAKAGDIDQIKDHIKEIWDIDDAGSAPEYLIPRSSSIYPDEDLLITIISVFSHNGNLNAALLYINHFERYYNLDLSNQILWRVLINHVKFFYDDNQEELVKAFKSIWNLMKHKNVKFSSSLYYLRCEILGKVEPELLRDDLPLIYSQYFRQINKIHASRLQGLLDQYIRSTITHIYKQNIEADEVVVKLIIDYSVSKEQQEILVSKAQDIKKLVLEENKKFKELQFLYDEEEEENNLW